MDDSLLWEKCTELYSCLEENKCLCQKDYKIFFDVFKEYFENSYSCMKSECQLLFLNTIRLSAEIYSQEISTSQTVCNVIHDFFIELYTDETILFKKVETFLNISDNYVSWILAKTLSSIIYIAELPLLRKWTNFLVTKLIMHSNESKCLKLIELLTSFVHHGVKPSTINDCKSKCCNTVHHTLPSVKDHYICILNELKLLWQKMVDIFIKSPRLELDKRKELEFLTMWKLINENPLGDESSVFLNKHYILDFVSEGNLTKSNTPLYMELIIQIFHSSLKCQPWESTDGILIENAVSCTDVTNILQLFSKNDPVFCGSMRKAFPEESDSNDDLKINLIAKKCIFVFLNLMAEFQSELLLNEIYQKISDFILNNTPITTLPYNWIIQLFMDEDDLLFGAMLACTRIYEHFQNNTKEYLTEKMLSGEFNPHVVFIQFLHLIGYDHNELLSFLISDETCCLLYLTQYLKLLLKEQDLFIIAYKTFSANKNSDSIYYKMKKRKASTSQTEDSTLKSQTIKSCKTGFSKSANYLNWDLNPQTNSSSLILESSTSAGHLVSYSSSSSSDEETEMQEVNIFRVGIVIKNLRESIQKLVDLKEFPYNATPFLSILKLSEDLLR